MQWAKGKQPDRHVFLRPYYEREVMDIKTSMASTWQVFDCYYQNTWKRPVLGHPAKYKVLRLQVCTTRAPSPPFFLRELDTKVDD